jgi:hypothetical protein
MFYVHKSSFNSTYFEVILHVVCLYGMLLNMPLQNYNHMAKTVIYCRYYSGNTDHVYNLTSNIGNLLNNYSDNNSYCLNAWIIGKWCQGKRKWSRFPLKYLTSLTHVTAKQGRNMTKNVIPPHLGWPFFKKLIPEISKIISILCMVKISTNYNATLKCYKIFFYVK